MEEAESAAAEQETSFECEVGSDGHIHIIINPFGNRRSQSSANENFSNESGERGSSWGSNLPIMNQALLSKHNRMTESKSASREPASSSSNLPLMEAPLISHQPIENQLLSGDQNNNGGIADPSAANAQNPLELDLQSPSFGPPLIEEHQSHLPTREHLDAVVLPAGASNESHLNHANSKENLVQTSYSTFDPSHGNTTNSRPMIRSSSINLALSKPAQPYPATTVELVPQNCVVQSFPQEHEVNSMINQNDQFNTQLQNTFQNELSLTPRIASENQSSTSSSGQLMRNNNMITEHSQQAYLCHPSPFTQTSIGMGFGDGRSCWFNQQQSDWLSLNQSPYGSLIPYGPRGDQFMAANGFDPQYGNSMIHGPSMHCRHQQIINWLQQQNQVPGMTNGYDQFSMLPEFSTCPSHRDVLPLPPGLSTPPRHPQLEQAYKLQNINDSQYCSSVQPGFLKRSPQVQLMSDLGQINPAAVADPRSNSSTSSRPQAAQLQKFLNQTARINATNPGLNNPQPSQALNSDYQQNGILGPCSQAKRPFETRESSSSSKRLRREPTTDQEMHQTALSPQQISNPFPPRPIKNGVYDPMFEEIGQPIDPHLRMFAML